MTSLLADLRAQPDFRTELWSQPEAEPKSEVTHWLFKFRWRNRKQNIIDVYISRWRQG